MPEELKPFMPIIYRLYINYGEQYYPTCIVEWDEKRIVQEKIDEKTILDYATDYVMRLQPCD
jgi:hypothetical protein